MSSSGSNRADRTLTSVEFDSLLEWLDADRERAGAKYEEIRRRLVKIFMGRACISAEDLADETINRVISKLSAIKSDFRGDPERYFYAVAHNVHREYLGRKPVQPAAAPDAPTSARVELELRCLEQCLESLPESERHLLLQYYGEGRKAQEKVDVRNELAKKLGISVATLRIRAFRSKAHLQKCMKRCLEAQEL